MTVTSLENLTEKDIRLFWAKIDVKSEEDCWIWNGSKNVHGYGLFGRKRKGQSRIAVLSHRLSYILSVGPIPVEQPFVRHKCDVKACCNPKHLEVGTPEQNSQDMVMRGRHWTNTMPERILRGEDHWARRKPELIPRGEDNGNSVLTHIEVEQIRNEYSAGGISQRALSSKFGVCQGTIWQVVKRNYWK